MSKQYVNTAIACKNKYTNKHLDLLETTIKQELENHHLGMGKLSDRTYQDLGYKSSTSAMGYISPLCDGYIYGTYGTPNNREERLRMLAVVLNALEIPEAHPLIKKLRRLDKDFRYVSAASTSEAGTDIADILES
jgi:hypothetical protein